MGTVGAIFSAAAEGLKLAWTLFGARNAPAMQANAKAATLAKIRSSVDTHITAQDTAAVERDIAS